VQLILSHVRLDFLFNYIASMRMLVLRVYVHKYGSLSFSLYACMEGWLDVVDQVDGG